MIKAKFAGRCVQCGEPIEAGEWIEWSVGEGAAHARCAAPEADAGEAVPEEYAARLERIFARQAAEHAAKLAAGPADLEADESDLYHCPTHGKSLGTSCPVCASHTAAGLDKRNAIV